MSREVFLQVGHAPKGGSHEDDAVVMSGTSVAVLSHIGPYDQGRWLRNSTAKSLGDSQPISHTAFRLGI